MNVEEIVKTTLQAEIIKALKSAPEAIEAMVEAAIKKPVDPGNGSHLGYSSGRVPYLEWLVGETIRNHLYKAVEEEFSSRHDEIREAVRKHLSGEAIADGITKAVLKSASETWRISVKFEADKD